MKPSQRVQKLSESITLKLNAKASEMSSAGTKVYNLTAGQLPFRPMPEFVNLIRSESDFLHSFQYGPVAGFKKLREKLLNHIEETRNISLDRKKFDCIISNGGKHAIANIFASLINSGDEVILLAPFWVSYPEMINLYGGKLVVVESSPFDVYVPSIEAIKNKITDKTKLIVINSPNNPSGTHYSEKWMKEFSALMIEHPNVTILSDEIYFQLYYYDPKPTYFYQFEPSLLNQTIIVDGISKTLACTGLRIGYTIAPTAFINVLNKLQGQTASGANSLVQKALENFNFDHMTTFLEPIKKHLRTNAEVLGESLRKYKMGHLWYQPQSAFYYLIDFSTAPIRDKYQGITDASVVICEELLEKYSIALVPGQAFGMPNTARISLVLEKEPFAEAAEILARYLSGQ